MNILVINCGSSSIKYQLFEIKKKVPLAKGLIEEIGKVNSFQTHWIGKRIIKKKGKIVHYQQGLERILDFLTDKDNGLIKDTSEISAVGHRVVHGGEKYSEPILINDKVMETIRSYIFLAPLHNYPNLMGIEAARSLLAGVPQVAVFDTAFHQTLAPKVFLYALPYEYYEKYRIRRYGFHGTSHRYVAYKAAKILKKPLKNLRIITCHLGNGCSIAAINKGKSIDTSMGFTPLEGLVMGTRCGDIDAAAVLFLMKKGKLEINQMDNILNKQSGLLGISGLSNDLREIQREAQKGNGRAQLALEIFIYRIKKYIGAYSAILGGLDVLVFTAGIGENQPHVRSRICQGLGFLGIYLDERENKTPSKSARLISAETSPGKVLVVPTNEEAIIAHETWQVVRRLVAK